jgi:hypothetical protein
MPWLGMRGAMPALQAHFYDFVGLAMIHGSGSQSVFRRSTGINGDSPGDLWIHSCNGYFEFT